MAAVIFTYLDILMAHAAHTAADAPECAAVVQDAKHRDLSLCVSERSLVAVGAVCVD